MLKPLLLKVVFKPASRYADDSISLKQVTAEEVSTDDFKIIDEYRGKTGWILFKPNAPNADDIPTEEATVTGKKSMSTRLRNALFAKHMHVGGDKDSFPEYYEKVMEGFIKSVNESYER
jgi:hypothetical protein